MSTAATITKTKDVNGIVRYEANMNGLGSSKLELPSPSTRDADAKKPFVLTPRDVDPDMFHFDKTPRPVLRQYPINLTLSARALFFAAGVIIVALQLFDPLVTQAALVAIPLLVLLYCDYSNFLGLGPGGVPSNLNGYLTVTYMRLWTLRDNYSTCGLHAPVRPATGLLQRRPITHRPGPRPKVAGIVPQRMITQQGTLHHHRLLCASLRALSATQPEQFATEVSCFERHGLALFVRNPVNETCMGEVAHIHSSDFSLHVSLHPDDLRDVVQKGWGQRHPLAWRWFGMKTSVPETLTMIYGPRNDHELRTICTIIEAAIWFVADQEAQMVPAMKGYVLSRLE